MLTIQYPGGERKKKSKKDQKKNNKIGIFSAGIAFFIAKLFKYRMIKELRMKNRELRKDRF